MINSDRIVPVTKTDLISLYGLILKQDSNNADLTALVSGDVIGNFQITDGTDPLIADQPVVSCDIETGVSAATLYFVAADNYVGFSIDGVAEEAAEGSVDVVADGSLYKAVLATGDITITKVGF